MIETQTFTDTEAFASFSVSDVPKARDFYSRVLGLKVAELDGGLLELKLASGTRVLLYLKPGHTAASFTVLNFPVDNLEATVDELAARGVRFEKYEGEIETDEKGIHSGEIGPKLA